MFEMIFETKPKTKTDAKVILLKDKTKPDYKILKDFLSKDEFEAIAINDETYCAKTKLIILRYKDKPNSLDLQKLGGSLVKKLWKNSSVAILADANEAYNMAFGFELGSYSFDKYKTKKKKEDFLALEKLVFVGDGKKEDYKDYASLANSVRFARDLSSEPANNLTPKIFVEEIKRLEYLGLEIEILDKKELTKKGFNMLLSVSQGSANDPYVAIIKWVGNKKQKDFDITLVGKGVCFDSGGISIKPGQGMEEMKQDMTGAGVVVSTMKALALQKSKKNVLGAVGLVENMPSGTATRPGDIVTSLSGQTVEIINTDAEGRLVLGDVLWYVQEKYNAKKIIDIATLTGAIVVSLASVRAGIMGNCQKMADALIKSGDATGEKVWQFPMDEEFDKMIDSDIADIKNISGSRGGGSITAGCFLQRFIKKDTQWIHLDIAGVDLEKKGTPLCPKGATGFGVRLFNHFIKE